MVEHLLCPTCLGRLAWATGMWYVCLQCDYHSRRIGDDEATDEYAEIMESIYGKYAEKTRGSSGA